MSPAPPPFQQSLREEAEAISIWGRLRRSLRVPAFALLRSDRLAQPSRQVAVRSSSWRGDQVLHLYPIFVGSVLRCQYLSQRRERRTPLVSICVLLPPFVGDDSFDGKDDARPDWKLGVSWEVPACCCPRVQFDELRVLGACSDHLLLPPPSPDLEDSVLRSRSCSPESSRWSLSIAMKEPDVQESSFFWTVCYQLAVFSDCVLHLFHDVVLSY